MLTLHVGAHKTATTHLQQTLQANAGVIARAGVTCLCPPDLRGGTLRLGFIASGGGAPEDARAALGGRLTGAKEVLISEENILGTAHDPEIPRQGRFYPQAEARLARVIDACAITPVRLMLGVRDPAGFLVSAYGQRLLAGRIAPFGAYLRGCEPAALRWSELVGRLCAVAGVSGCTVWRYEDWPAVAPDVLAAMLPESLAAAIEVAPAVSNPGLSQRAQRWVLRRHSRGETDAQTARVARMKFPKSETEPAFQPLREDTRTRSAAAYARDLAALTELPGVSFIAP